MDPGGGGVPRRRNDVGRTRQDAIRGGAPLHEMWVHVLVWVEGKIAQVIPYNDIARAHAAAEALAGERGGR